LLIDAILLVALSGSAVQSLYCPEGCRAEDAIVIAVLLHLVVAAKNFLRVRSKSDRKSQSTPARLRHFLETIYLAIGFENTTQHTTMSASQPEVIFNSLPHADGSATYSCNGYTIIGTVNGPIEAQRRDELAEESFLEVNIRPASGTGG